MIKYFTNPRKYVVVGVILAMIIVWTMPVAAVGTANEHIHDHHHYDVIDSTCDVKNPEAFIYSYKATSNCIVYSDISLDKTELEQIIQNAVEAFPQYGEIIYQSSASACSHTPSNIGGCSGYHTYDTSPTDGCCYHINCLRPATCSKCGEAYIYIAFEGGGSHNLSNGDWGTCSICGRYFMKLR